MTPTFLKHKVMPLDPMSEPKRILVVAHHRPLRETRARLLELQGYVVESVETDDEAMTLLESERFHLVLLGRKSKLPKEQIDQRIRKRYPDLLILKIEPADAGSRGYSSRVIDYEPRHVVAALHEMLDEDVVLRPLPPFPPVDSN
ncbi:MAG: hypothetical protein ACR2JE_10680 [Acidobacteriaceae bacterium]